MSYNRLFGEIPQEFANQIIPTNATADLSFNNFTREIPDTTLFLNQEATSYAGNPKLCSKPLKNLCLIPSTISVSTSLPAIPAIPKTIDLAPAITSQEVTNGLCRDPGSY